MNQIDKILEIAAYTIPSIVTGAVAYYFFTKYFSNEENRRRHTIHKENQKQSLPLRLQAYERMTLFLERINPNQLLIRLSPKSTDVNEYMYLLTNAIEQEFEHNIAQQIYMTNECWTMITTAKNTTLQLLRNKAATPSITTAKELQEAVLKEGIEESYPSLAALTFIKNEVRDIL